MISLILLSLLSSNTLCPCDCNGDGVVAVDEIVVSVTSALQDGATPLCAAADSSGDSRVTVDEILRGVTAALYGCGVPPPPTPTATPSSAVVDLYFSYFHVPSLNFSCAEDLEGAPRLVLCVSNQGRDPAGPFAITASRFLQWEEGGLAPGGEVCFSGPLSYTTPVSIDPANQVDESDETNNEESVAMPTITRLPGCTPAPTPPLPSPTPTATPLIPVSPTPTVAGGCVAGLQPDRPSSYTCNGLFGSGLLRHRCVGPTAGTSCFGVIASDDCCWSIATDAPFLALPLGRRCGRREVCFDVAENLSGQPRDAEIRIGERIFKVRQQP